MEPIEENKFENKMYWYHWIAVFMMMGACAAFWVIPEKSLPLGIGIIAFGYIGYLIIIKLPRSEMKDLD